MDINYRTSERKISITPKELGTCILRVNDNYLWGSKEVNVIFHVVEVHSIYIEVEQNLIPVKNVTSVSVKVFDSRGNSFHLS